MSKRALICGASEGIGAAFARRLAAQGYQLVLVARRQGPLDALAAELGPATQVVVQDLASPTLLDDLAAAVDLDVDLLVCNAASVGIAPILEEDPRQMDAMIAVNVSAPMRLCRHIGARMAERGRGGIVLMSSLAGLQGTAMVGTYGATKAFLIGFGEALWEELRPRGVDVVVCIAGATSTPGFDASTSADRRAMAFPGHPDAVAEAALRGLGKGPVVVPGAINKLTHFVTRHLLSRRAAVRFFSRNTRKIYTGHEGS